MVVHDVHHAVQDGDDPDGQDQQGPETSRHAPLLAHGPATA